MNAVADDPIDRLPRKLERLVHGADRSELEDSLQAWGKWIEEHADYEGYPQADAINSWVEGFGGGKKGHRILCLVMPIRVQATHLRVVTTLNESEREAIWIQYVTVTKEDGTIWTMEERLAKAGILRNAFDQRLYKARRRLLGLVD